MTSEETQQKDHELLIRLEGKVDTILDTLKQLPVIENRVRDLELSGKTRQEQVNNLCHDVESLEEKNVIWSLGNSIAIIIGTILGIAK